MSDIYVKGWIKGSDDMQSTDIHYRSVHRHTLQVSPQTYSTGQSTDIHYRSVHRHTVQVSPQTYITGHCTNGPHIIYSQRGRNDCRLFFKFCLIFQRYCPNGISPMGKSGCRPQLRQNCATQPTVHAGSFSVSIIHRTLTWTTRSLTCAQMLIHAIAHGGVRTP